MRRLFIMLLMFVSMVAASAFAVPSIPWMFPADHRIIYQIDTSGLSSEYNVYVELNIPESAYSGLVTDLNSEWICWYLGHNAVHELWPRAFYASDADLTQRELPPYAVLSTYTYSLPQCGPDATISVPKAIRLYVDALDTYNGNYDSFSHYILLYFVDDSVRMFSFVFGSADYVAIQRVNIPITYQTYYLAGIAGHYTPYGTYGGRGGSYVGGEQSWVFLSPIEVDISDAKHVFVYAFTYGVDGRISVCVEGTDGTIYRIGTAPSGKPCAYDVDLGGTIYSNRYTDIMPMLAETTGMDAGHFSKIVAVGAGGRVTGFTNGMDDFTVVVR